jgi:mitochondrial fission process protein 1
MAVNPESTASTATAATTEKDRHKHESASSNPRVSTTLESVLDTEESNIVPVLLRNAPRLVARMRPLSYSSEVGEAVRHSTPSLIRPLYAVAIGVVAMDVVVAGWGRREESQLTQAVSLADHVAWHSLASFIAPSVIIHQSVKRSKPLFAGMPLSAVWKQRGPSIVGLLMIPLVVHPIDSAVDSFFDYCLRPFYASHLASHSHLVNESTKE